MDHYILWFNLKNSQNGKDFVQSLDDYMLRLKSDKLIAEYRIVRRKLGLGPSELGEFMVDISFEDTCQMDKAYRMVIEGIHENNSLESLHQKVNSQVKDFKASLYRDYPDAHIAVG